MASAVFNADRAAGAGITIGSGERISAPRIALGIACVSSAIIAPALRQR